jgi:nicotinamide riboside kinase
MQNIRICLVGAQGTGKTTVLNIFKDAQYPVITEVVRNLMKSKGIKINQDGDEETQSMIFNEYAKVLSETPKYVSDRGLFDVVSYSLAALIDKKISEDFYVEQVNQLEKFIEENPDIVYIYFPIEFPVVDDGVRSTDEDYRKAIDKCIQKHLELMKVSYLTVHGTPSERFCQILEYVSPDLV